MSIPVESTYSFARVLLTLHGGSGTDDQDLRKAIAAGINIIHINTELRVAWRRGLEDALAKLPHEVVPYKILPFTVESVKQIVSSRLQLFNMGGKAPRNGTVHHASKGDIAMAITPDNVPKFFLGPPPHKKGAPVFLDYDQVELDAAYDQHVYAPLLTQILKRFASNSDLARARIGEPRRESYGATDAEQLDIYPTASRAAPIFVFIHGGAWLSKDPATNYGFVAELFVRAGAHFVVPEFISVDKAGGDLRVLVSQVRRAIAWTYENAVSFGGNPNKLFLGGHSSGGHLCSLALVTDWKRDFDLPADTVKGGLCMSGMYDLKPVRLSTRSSYVRFTDEIEDEMSSQRHLDLLHAPIIVTYGTNETPEFQRQSREFVAAVKAVGKPVELIEAANYNHFEMVESLGNPYGPNGRAALTLIERFYSEVSASRCPL